MIFTLKRVELELSRAGADVIPDAPSTRGPTCSQQKAPHRASVGPRILATTRTLLFLQIHISLLASKSMVPRLGLVQRDQRSRCHIQATLSGEEEGGPPKEAEGELCLPPPSKGSAVHIDLTAASLYQEVGNYTINFPTAFTHGCDQQTQDQPAPTSFKRSSLFSFLKNNSGMARIPGALAEAVPFDNVREPGP